MIDASDPVFAQLRVWIDYNQDGASGTAEIFTLAQSSIASISIDAGASYVDSNGNAVVASATFSRTDGTSFDIYEVNFATNPQNSILPVTTAISADALKIFELDGFGLLTDLRIAMSLDPAFLQMVQSSVANSADLTGDQFDAAFRDILYRWAGVNTFAAGGDGPEVNARSAGFIDAYFGEKPQDVHTSATPRNGDNCPTVWDCDVPAVVGEL